MGVDISVGDSGSEDYISENLGSYTSFLSWKHDIAEKEGIDFWKGYNGKFKLVLTHSGNYKVEELPILLGQLNEIKKLNVEEYDTIIFFGTEEVLDLGKMKISKGLKHKKTQIVRSKDPVIDKFIRICNIAIDRRLPIKIG
jgi:hypothetical protein